MMIRKILMLLIVASGMAGIVAFLSEWGVFAPLLHIFLVAGAVTALSFRAVYSRLKIKDEMKMKICFCAVYWLLWSGFFLFVVTMIGLNNA